MEPHVNIETGEVKTIIKSSVMQVWVPIRNMCTGDWVDLVTLLHQQIKVKWNPPPWL
jgi:hypothetical protein